MKILRHNIFERLILANIIDLVAVDKTKNELLIKNEITGKFETFSYDPDEYFFM